MAGALAGGALTAGLSWRWVFLINVPIGAGLIVLASVALAADRTAGRDRLDLAGAVTGTGGLAALVYGVMQTADHGWLAGPVIAPVLAGVLLLVVFVVLQARFVARPMMPLRLYRRRGVTVGAIMLLLCGGIGIGLWYFTSLLLQHVLGFGPLEAGLGQTPAAVTFLVVARIAAGLLPRTGARPLVVVGSTALVAGFGWLSRTEAGVGYLGAVLGPTLLVAVGIGLTFPTLMAAATADVPEQDAGVVGGLVSTANQVGGAVALAALATAAATRTADGRSAAALAAGYDLVFLAAAGIGLAMAVTGLLLPDGRSRG